MLTKQLSKPLRVCSTLAEEESLNELANIMRCYSPDYKFYAVGGCVRDAILKKTPHDVDLCSALTPDQVRQVIESCQNHYPHWKVWNSGEKHGTVTLTDGKRHTSFEITTFRTDGEYSDNRHPDKVAFTGSLEEDLKRRDFTINACAYDIAECRLLSADGADEDFKLRRIRCVGDPNERFREDALRMLRAIRFAAQLGFMIDPATYDAICTRHAYISNVSVERIRDEIQKIICSPHPEMLQWIHLIGMDFNIASTYALQFDLHMMMHQKQDNPWHYTDLFHHTMDVVRNVPAGNPTLRWAALYHDIGKVKTHSENNDHFYGHAEESAKIAENDFWKLRLPADMVQKIVKLIKYHDNQIEDISDAGVRRLANRIGPEDMDDYIALRYADAMAQNQLVDDGYSGDWGKPVKIVARFAQQWEEVKNQKQPVQKRQMAINGNDIMKEFNLASGPQIGKLLDVCFNDILQFPEDNNREKLLKIVAMDLTVEGEK